MIGRLNHVAIAVPDLEAAAAQYRNTLGATVGAPQDEPDHGVTVIFIELPNTKIELLYPLGENSPIQGFLDKNPSGGIHHVCYEVDDILYQDCRFLQAGDRDQPGLAAIREAVRNNTPCRQIIRNYRKDGSAFWNELSITPVFNEGDQLTYYIGIQKDVTPEVEAKQRVRELEAEVQQLREQLAALQG